MTKDQIEKIIAELKAENQALIEKNKELTQAKLEAQWANNAKNKFFVTANHDLRQPLHALGLFATSLEQKIIQEIPENNQSFLDVVSQIQNSQKILEGHLVSLVDLAKLESGVVLPEKQVLWIGEVFSRLKAQYQPLADAKEIKLNIADVSLRTISDKTYLERMLSYLMANSLNYSLEGEVTISCEVKGEKVLIQIQDTGVGIPESETENIFREFYKLEHKDIRNAQNLGLGLANVKRLSGLLDHPVNLKSVVGEGSTFCVEVPCDYGLIEGRKEIKNEGMETNFNHEPRIVVIDDDTVVLDSMSILLETWGYAYFAAETLQKALESIQEKSSPIVLIIADFRLGEGISGMEAVTQIRDKIGQTIPAVMVTGDTDSSLRVEAKENGCLLMHKPLQPAKLRQVIRNAIAGKIRL
ncbi:MAG: hybrid sensor histidine kinase/response regulator [Alphaproteobacteria bacterium]|nr:hybrid sensor histidine kinase/response regulator [Alphaproteobacteria bacterium]